MSMQDSLRELEELSTAYYRGEEQIPDREFDRKLTAHEERWGKVQWIGDPANSPSYHTKVELPYHLGSLDKVKKDVELRRWQFRLREKYSVKRYVITEKIDGLSVLLKVQNGIIGQICTHNGEGDTGYDVSHLLPYLFPGDSVKVNTGELPAEYQDCCAVRGELVLYKRDFQKYGGDYKNARAMVAGLVNSRPEEVNARHCRKIRFLAYELISPEPQSKQLEWLEQLGFLQPRQELVTKLEELAEKYLEWKEEAEYRIDGLVVCADVSIRKRVTRGNPEHAFAFKVDEAAIPTKVLEVEWEVSRHGRLNPVLIVEEVEICETLNNRATAHNAHFIVKNKIGPGAIVELTKGGDIIPKVVDVVKGTKSSLPDAYRWDENGVFIYTFHENCEEVQIKRLAYFFKKMDLKHIGEMTVRKMYDVGLDTVLKILTAKRSKLRKVEGFQEKSVERVRTTIRELNWDRSQLARLGAASGVFKSGMNERRLQLILDEIPNLFECKRKTKELREIILGIKGLGECLTELFLEGFPACREFIEELVEHGFIDLTEETRLSKDNPLYGKKIVVTGTRDKEILRKIQEHGGQVMSAVSGKTDILVIKSLGRETSKMREAKERGTKVMSLEKFTEKYL